jgi:exosome complex component CSL4
MVRAKVLSLGDTRSYFLTTAENDLGVIHGLSADGNAMKALSYELMQDPATGKEEPRKVAAPSKA